MDRFLDLAGRYGPYLAALAGLLMAALANGLETGLYRLNRIRLRLRADAGERPARTLLALLADLRGLIIICLISCNVGMYITTVVVTMVMAAAAAPEEAVKVEILATAVLTPIFFVFADVLPKSLFAYEADRWTYPLAGPLRAARALLGGIGLVPALKGISNLVLRITRRPEGEAVNPFSPRQLLRALLQEGAADGVITRYQDELVEKVLALREKRVRDAMIPLARVAAIPADITREKFIEELRRYSYTRLPVYEGAREAIVGIIRINDVLAAENGALDIRTVMSREFVAVPPDMPVGQAIFRMRKARAALAVVQDFRGRAVGIITLKDLVEEIVGELAIG